MNGIKQLKYFAIILVINIISSCKNDPLCDPINQISGDIIEEYDLGKCFERMDNSNMILYDTTDMLNLRNRIDSIYIQKFQAECDTIKPDTTDFSRYTIIGQYASGIGCNVNFHKTFTRDEANKVYIYSIRVEECGNCTTEEFSMNWILVNKIDTSYSIQFEILLN